MDDGFKDPDKIKDALVYYEPGHEDQLQLHECILLLASLGAAAIFIPCENQPDARVRAAAVNAELTGCAVLAVNTVSAK